VVILKYMAYRKCEGRSARLKRCSNRTRREAYLRD